MYLYVGALLFGMGESIRQVGVYSSSPDVGDRPLTITVVFAHNKVKEFFFNTQLVWELFLLYLCVDALWFGGYGYTVPTLRPPNKGTDNFIKKQYKLGISSWK